jgi:peptide/nickel transport system substrate-binding protein
MKSTKTTKRIFLLLSFLIIISMVLAACGTPAVEEEVVAPEEEVVAEEPVVEEEEDTGEAIVAEEATPVPIEIEVSAYGEAPMLADMVAAGDLPPVEERLPMEEDIMVVAGVDGIGEYGGVWHGVTWWPEYGNIAMTIYDPPVRWNADYTGYEPGLLRSWDIAADGMTITWNFRRGLKWSDGVPFTMDDMAFWWEMANDDAIGVVTVPWWGFKSDGEPMDVTFPDDVTMIMQWDKPQYITNFIVAQGFWEWLPMHRPMHFYEQYHPDYTDGATYEGLEAVLHSSNGWFANTEGVPCLMAWCLESATPGERSVWVRNAYYWKVDTEGNQLPYIDRVDVRLIEDTEVRLLEASQGKFEATFRASTDPNDIPFLYEQAEAGDYYLHEGSVNGAGSWPGWLIDMNFADSETYPDTWEEIRDLIQDKNFRRGLSHALNRERLIDVFWDGIGYPTNATISPQAWHFASSEGQAVYEEWRDAFIEFDQALAGQFFDDAGYSDADGDGWRDLPSGAAFTLVIDLGDWSGVPVEAAEVYAGNLEEVGVQVLINELAGAEFGQRQEQGLYMIRNMHASELDIWTYPDWMFPVRNNRSWPLEGNYRATGGESGWEPVPGTTYAYELQALYDLGLATAGVDERHQIVYDAIRIHIDEGPFMIGASGDQPMPVVIRNGFMGVPDLVVLGPWAPGSPGNLNPEQFWMQADLRAESEGN